MPPVRRGLSAPVSYSIFDIGIRNRLLTRAVLYRAREQAAEHSIRNLINCQKKLRPLLSAATGDRYNSPISTMNTAIGEETVSACFNKAVDKVGNITPARTCQQLSRAIENRRFDRGVSVRQDSAPPQVFGKQAQNLARLFVPVPPVMTAGKLSVLVGNPFHQENCGEITIRFEKAVFRAAI
jgi:hypothetical protein